MPYAAPLALLVAVLDLIPLVGATLGGALLVIVGLFVEPWKAVVLLVFVLVYQQVESNLLQPLVYSQAVQLNGDRKSTRLNSSHANISYAVFCLKKKNITN